MRVALLHNTSAGSEDHTAAELTEAIERAGHEVAHVTTRLDDLTAALHEQPPCDLVVIAGGDGTVGRAACQLSSWQVPLSILALGTANNTARSLGLPRRPRKLAKTWHHGQRVPFDLALLDDGAERQRFSEAVGWGAFAGTVAEAKRAASGNTVGQTLKRDRKLFRSLVGSTSPRHYRIDVDGRDCSGEYILVEVMNVPLLGPQLELSPLSDPGDGVLELVLVADVQRAALQRLAKKSGSAEAGPLRTERGARILVEASEGLLHRDGGLQRHAPGARQFEIRVEPRVIHYLR